MPGDRLLYEDFKDQAGTAFALTETEPLVTLTLADVVTMKKHTPGPEFRDPFSLYFHGPAAFVLPQRIYAMQHDALGTLEIFLVPISQDSKAVVYEAVFN